MAIVYPDSFLEIRFQELKPPPPTTGLCAGYDNKVWQGARLAAHLFNWLPYAALNQENQLAFGSHNFLDLLRNAAAHIYKTKKTATRGELGELLLHLACIQHVGTVPVVCKLVLKSSSNDTVKGFDGVHLLKTAGGFEIWLGESKFYLDPQEAIRDAINSISAHIAPAFLETEKAMLMGHVGKDIPHRDEVVKLFKAQTPGDKLLNASVFPILIAYESPCVASFEEVTAAYIDAVGKELSDLRNYFAQKAGDIKLRFHLIFVPINTKKEIVENFDKLLEPYL